MSEDNFKNYADTPMAPAQFCFTIAPSDTADLVRVTKGIYVGQGGDIILRTILSEADVTFKNVPAGATLDVRACTVRSTGTTAGYLVGMA